MQRNARSHALACFTSSALFRRKDDTNCRLRRAFEHVLAFLVKAGSDGVSVLEGNEQRWQRGTIVIAVFEELLRLFNAQTGEPLHFPQTIDPGSGRGLCRGRGAGGDLQFATSL